MSFGITFYLGLNMTHPHAEVLRAIADGVPLSEFEARYLKNKNDLLYSELSEDFGSAMRQPEQWQVRRKPRTHVVNGFTVPAPMDKEPGHDDMYFIPELLDEFFYAEVKWRNESQDMRWLKLGLCFATREAAIANAKAMLKINPDAA